MDNLSRSTPIRIDVLYSEDCPGKEPALELVKDVVAREGAPVQLEVHEVATEEEAQRLRFPGSPTVRVNGMDIADDPGLAVGLACRTYVHDGGVSPVPPREALVWAVQKAMRQPQIEGAGGDEVVGRPAGEGES